MDSKAEQRLLKLYDNVPNDLSSNESQSSDPYQDVDGEYDILDPTYQPSSNESDNSNESENSVIQCTGKSGRVCSRRYRTFAKVHTKFWVFLS